MIGTASCQTVRPWEEGSIALAFTGHGAADGDLFFSARLQMMNARDDKYILFDHPGGPFTIRLRQSPPWHWAVTRPLLDSFDEVVLVFPQNGGGAIMVVLGLLALAAGPTRLQRRRCVLDLAEAAWDHHDSWHLLRHQSRSVGSSLLDRPFDGVKGRSW